MSRPVKFDCSHLPVPFTYTGNSLSADGLLRRQASRITGGSEKLSAGVRELVIKPLYVLCTYNWVKC